MKLTFDLTLKFASMVLVLGISGLVHYFVRGQQPSTQKSTGREQQTNEEVRKFCGSDIVRSGQKCGFAAAAFSYDQDGNLDYIECFYACPNESQSEGFRGEFQVVQSKNPELTSFDNLTVDEQRAALSDNGPLVPKTVNTNDISMRAFIKAEWPFYVSYSLKGSPAALTITAKYIDQFAKELMPGEKRQAEFRIPEQFGSELRVANITINIPLGSEFELHAIGILGKGSRSKNHVSRSSLSPDLPISDVTVTPNKISTQKEEKVSYSFFSRSPYTSAAAEFFSFKLNAKHEIVPTRVYSRRYDSIKANEKTGPDEWDGKNSKGQFSFGVHRLQIRTWRGQGSGGEWFGPYYGPQVEVSK